MINTLQNSKTARVIFILIGTIVVQLAWSNAPLIYKSFHIGSASLRLTVRGIVTLIPMFIFLAGLHKSSDIIKSIGLSGNIIKGFVFAAICCLPLFIGFPLIGSFDDALTADLFLRRVVIAAVLEEVVFRGFYFGQLFRYGKVGFVWAVLIPALLFGMGHLYQGHNLSSSIMAFGVTALGAVYFSWVYVECNYNLWVPIGLHMFMNLCWTVFPIAGNENAVGTLIPNILRLSSIVLTVIMIVIYKKRHNSRVFSYPIISI